MDASSNVVRTKLAKNILRAAFPPEPPKVNELFMPRRMAYVMDLNDDESDIPVTLMRSKAECPTESIHAANNSSSTLTTNDIVINKLVQILSYLRQSGSGKKDLKKLKKAGLPISKPSIEEAPIKKEDDIR